MFETVLLLRRVSRAIVARDIGSRSLIELRMTARLMFLTTLELALMT
jgi:hypothetical protein